MHLFWIAKLFFFCGVHTKELSLRFRRWWGEIKVPTRNGKYLEHCIIQSRITCLGNTLADEIVKQRTFLINNLRLFLKKIFFRRPSRQRTAERIFARTSCEKNPGKLWKGRSHFEFVIFVSHILFTNPLSVKSFITKILLFLSIFSLCTGVWVRLHYDGVQRDSEESKRNGLPDNQNKRWCGKINHTAPSSSVLVTAYYSRRFPSYWFRFFAHSLLRLLFTNH